MKVLFLPGPPVTELKEGIKFHFYLSSSSYTVQTNIKSKNIVTLGKKKKKQNKNLILKLFYNYLPSLKISEISELYSSVG